MNRKKRRKKLNLEAKLKKKGVIHDGIDGYTLFLMQREEKYWAFWFYIFWWLISETKKLLKR